MAFIADDEKKLRISWISYKSLYAMESKMDINVMKTKV
jgi:hypothetical protein